MTIGLPPNFRVLIVEDFDDAREMYRDFFEIHCFEVFEARDGLEGLEVARRIRPDVIVLDAAMPRLDGFSVLREIRADPLLSDVPVLMLSASAEPNYAELAARSGATRALEKPCLPEELLAAIREVARHGRLRTVGG